MLMIWSPEGLGSYQFQDHVRTADESGFMIKLAGWLLLLMPLLVKLVQLLVK